MWLVVSEVKVHWEHLKTLFWSCFQHIVAQLPINPQSGCKMYSENHLSIFGIRTELKYFNSEIGSVVPGGAGVASREERGREGMQSLVMIICTRPHTCGSPGCGGGPDSQLGLQTCWMFRWEGLWSLLFGDWDDGGGGETGWRVVTWCVQWHVTKSCCVCMLFFTRVAPLTPFFCLTCKRKVWIESSLKQRPVGIPAFLSLEFHWFDWSQFCPQRVDNSWK